MRMPSLHVLKSAIALAATANEEATEAALQRVRVDAEDVGSGVVGSCLRMGGSKDTLIHVLDDLDLSKQQAGVQPLQMQ